MEVGSVLMVTPRASPYFKLQRLSSGPAARDPRGGSRKNSGNSGDALAISASELSMLSPDSPENVPNTFNSPRLRRRGEAGEASGGAGTSRRLPPLPADWLFSAFFPENTLANCAGFAQNVRMTMIERTELLSRIESRFRSNPVVLLQGPRQARLRGSALKLAISGCSVSAPAAGAHSNMPGKTKRRGGSGCGNGRTLSGTESR